MCVQEMWMSALHCLSLALNVVTKVPSLLAFWCKPFAMSID